MDKRYQCQSMVINTNIYSIELERHILDMLVMIINAHKGIYGNSQPWAVYTTSRDLYPCNQFDLDRFLLEKNVQSDDISIDLV